MSGYLEVTINGKLVHSKKVGLPVVERCSDAVFTLQNGDGYVDSAAKEKKILDAVGEALDAK